LLTYNSKINKIKKEGEKRKRKRKRKRNGAPTKSTGRDGGQSNSE
jgi:hypothetical protein